MTPCNRSMAQLCNTSDLTSTIEQNSRKWKDVLFVVQLTVLFIIAIANIIVILIYNRMKKKLNKKIPNYLMFSQSITDLFIVSNTILEAIKLQLSQAHARIEIVHLIYVAMLEYSLTIRLGMLMLAAVERYICITKPFFHRKFITKSRIVRSTIALWVISCVPPAMLLSLMECKVENTSKVSVRVYSFVFDIGMLTCITATIFTLILSLRASTKSRTEHDVLTKRCSGHSHSERGSSRVVLIFMLMSIAYIVTFLPFTIGRALYDFDILIHVSRYHQMMLISICHLLYELSALVNPFFTMFLKQDYNNALKDLCNRRQRNRRKKKERKGRCSRMD